MTEDDPFSLEDLDFGLGLQATGGGKALAALALTGQPTPTTPPRKPSAGSSSTAGTLALEDANQKEKAFLKVDQALAAAQAQLLQGKKQLAVLPTATKTCQQCAQNITEALKTGEQITARLTNLSAHRAFKEGEEEASAEELKEFLKKAQEALSSLSGHTAVAKALCAKHKGKA